MEEPITKEKIERIEFRVLSPDMISRISVVKIISPELYDADGYPTEGGLMDQKMGIIDPGLRCKTCGNKVKSCVGHFGYIELARPVLHIKYVPWVYDALRSTCWECGRVLVSNEVLDSYKEKLKGIEGEKGKLEKWDFTKEIIKKAKIAKKCPYCGAKHEKIIIKKPTTFVQNKKKLTPIDIRNHLEKIPDDDLIFLGLDSIAARPEWMILTLLPVPPVTIRPSITLESGQRSEDDLTHKLGDIVRTNQRLFENLNAGAPEVIVEDLWDLLQYHITTLFQNKVSQIPPARHRSGRPLKTLSERIKSKEGRFRRYLAGKRVNFSARTVISPDPIIGIEEVGIPLEIAEELTVPEIVTEWNKEHLKTYIENTINKVHPGAKYVISPDGKRKKVTEQTKDAIIEELAEGYIIERSLMNKDTVIFNRQPSLHRMSMMAHKVRILPAKTFRINPCAATPYNADFDGDEMNLHVPQTFEAISEAEELMSITKHIITPRYGLPIIGCAQDHISGNYLLTNESKLSKEDACQVLYKADTTEDLPESKTGKYDGKEIFSMILPKDLCYEGVSKGCKKCAECKKGRCEDGYFVEIKNGELKKGVIDANAIGAEKGKLIQKMAKIYGNEKTCGIIQAISKLGIAYLSMKGFSVLASDADMPEETNKEIKETIDSAYKEVDDLIKEAESRKLKKLPGRTLAETLEMKIMMALNRARNNTGRFVESNTNVKGATAVMAKAGARGSMLNLAYVCGCVGQTVIRGSRVNIGYENRTLPHFKKGDVSPTSKGFIRNGYKGGLNPYEMFFHAMVGRDSLMDTSMRTPKSGYMQRRLINALQDLKLEYDLTVRDGFNRVVQFKYGEDGVDVSKSDHGKVDLGE